MQFKPKTEKEIIEENLIADGVYPFECIDAEAKKSKAGNDMIEISLRVFLPDGRERALTDWLLESPAYKLFHFCAYTGLSREYESGSLTAPDCVGRAGFVKVGTQKDKTGQYPDRNSVRDYARQEIKQGGVTAKTQPTDAQLANQTGGADLEVPF